MWTIHTSLAGTFLFGQADLLEPDLCLPVGAMIGVVALGLWAIIKVKRWRDEAAEIRGVSHNDQVAQYEQLANDGHLSPEELARIKAQMEARFDPLAAPADQVPPPPNQPPDTSIQEK